MHTNQCPYIDKPEAYPTKLEVILKPLITPIDSRPLFLIGYRGVGKTTIARLLAAQLHWPAVDADDEIELLAGKTIREVFVDLGEHTFRDLEAEIVSKLVRRSNVVVALGGGAILRQQNRQLIAQSGRTIWLRAAPETIWQRMQGDASTVERRPNLTTAGGYEEVCRLVHSREAIYRQCADWSVDTEGSTPEFVATAILQWLNGT